MNLTDGATLTYTVSHEAWYSRVVERPEIVVSGPGWEFVVTEHDHGDRNPIRVGVFEDAFAAFAQIPEFFAALAEQQPGTLTGVRAILDEMGATDETPRVSPLRERPVSLRDRIAAGLDGLVIDEGVRVPAQDCQRIADIVTEIVNEG